MFGLDRLDASRRCLSRTQLALELTQLLVFDRELAYGSLVAHQTLKVGRNVASSGVISRKMQLTALVLANA